MRAGAKFKGGGRGQGRGKGKGRGKGRGKGKGKGKRRPSSNAQSPVNENHPDVKEELESDVATATDDPSATASATMKVDCSQDGPTEIESLVGPVDEVASVPMAPEEGVPEGGLVADPPSMPEGEAADSGASASKPIAGGARGPTIHRSPSSLASIAPPGSTIILNSHCVDACFFVSTHPVNKCYY